MISEKRIKVQREYLQSKGLDAPDSEIRKSIRKERAVVVLGIATIVVILAATVWIVILT
jgi:hypothetical protein